MPRRAQCFHHTISLDKTISHETIELRSGAAVPSVGLGLWKIDPGDTAEVIATAIQCGYRHFDCACDYGNEAQAGDGFAAAISSGVVSREDLWITSKLWNNFHRAEHVRPALERTLRDLQLDFLDLYLIHFPIALQYVAPDTRYPPGWFDDPDSDDPRMLADRVPLVETWEALVETQRAGLVREIGVSNFGTSLIRDLMNQSDVPPAMLQVELHPYLTQQKLVRFCQDAGIGVTGFSAAWCTVVFFAEHGGIE